MITISIMCKFYIENRVDTRSNRFSAHLTDHLGSEQGYCVSIIIVLVLTTRKHLKLLNDFLPLQDTIEEPKFFVLHQSLKTGDTSILRILLLIDLQEVQREKNFLVTSNKT